MKMMNSLKKMKAQNKTRTRGNVIVEDIKIGDVHYEYGYGVTIKCEVITLPELNEDGQYEWESRNLVSGNIINYLVDPEYPHYSVNLYDYEAYNIKNFI